MKKRILVSFMILCVITNIFTLSFAKTKKPNLKADAALMIDLDTGRYLYKLNESQKIQPGGLVKIMTAIVALEHISDTKKSVTADVNVLASYDYSFGHMGILANEKLTYDNLICGMLVYDAGDAAEVLSSTVMNSRDKFIKEMNKKAVDIGALNTKFTNPTGFPDKNQYSTVEDIYKITKYAMEIPYIQEAVGKSRYEMSPTNKYTEYRYLDNKNKFLSTSTTDKYYTSKAKGVKTSYIDDDNCSLIVQYETDSIKLMTIVAGSPYDGVDNHSYNDTSKLIQYGLNYYTSVKVVSEGEIFEEVELQNGRGEDRILLEAKDDVFINLPMDYDEDDLERKVTLKENISAPISKGQVLGTVKIMYKGDEYVSIELKSPKEIKANNIKGIFKKVWIVLTSPVLLVSMGLILIVVVWSILIFNKKKVYKVKDKK